MDTILGMIYYWPLSWAPKNFAFCQGQILPITGNNALFSLLGTRYGGNGTTTFGLPDLRGRVPIHQSLQNAPFYQLGNAGGTETVTLDSTQIPAHTHTLNAVNVGMHIPVVHLPNIPITASVPATTAPGTADMPGTNAVPAEAPDFSAYGIDYYMYGTPDGTTTMPATITIPNGPAAAVNPQPVIGPAAGNPANGGNSAPHNNMQPFLVMNYIIALQGYYPQRPW